MRGETEKQRSLPVYLNVEERIPVDHPLELVQKNGRR